ncbi:hypothetical protein AXF42_Ash014737 [Apostasia shenzhenica]|uniref:Uncharacterized protein n=1 Tax=Apostasia shenzhenica TaxID=1088818 RepID=A0A2H9ZW68_9ASPA|nr:hypothetical protein AXF42_Ash014737 [Apostasia shenzhenica]
MIKQRGTTKVIRRLEQHAVYGMVQCTRDLEGGRELLGLLGSYRRMDSVGRRLHQLLPADCDIGGCRCVTFFLQIHRPPRDD